MNPNALNGRVFQLNISNGGVPKNAIAAGDVTAFGLQGDRQANQELHGGPNAALCLYALENILALQAEGHPIYPGAAGENITLVGLDWSLVQPGVRLRLGSQVLVEVTRFTSPCSTIADAFKEGESKRISEKVNPGWSRVYARVLQPGRLQVSDDVQIVQPQPASE
jgi:MOSC domain-containing protein YiiM